MSILHIPFDEYKNSRHFHLTILASDQIFKKGVGGGGGLDRTTIFREVGGKEGVSFSGGRCNFYIKNNLKFEIFKYKKSVYKRKCFMS